MLSVMMQGIIMVSIMMLGVIILSVMVPSCGLIYSSVGLSFGLNCFRNFFATPLIG